MECGRLRKEQRRERVPSRGAEGRPKRWRSWFRWRNHAGIAGHGYPVDLHVVDVSKVFFFLFFIFLINTFFRTAIKACTLCAHQRWRCSPTRDGSREDDEDDEMEEVRSPRKRKRASTDEGGQDKKGKRKMTETDWEAETRWKDWVEARLGSMDLVLRKIAVCLEGIEEMMEERWYVKETETEGTEEKRDADGEEEAEVEDKMVE